MKNRYIVNDGLNIALPMAVDDDNMGALWVCTGVVNDEYTFVSALGTAALGWCALAENAVGFTLGDGVGNGTSAMLYGGAYLAVAVDGSGVASLAPSNDKVQGVSLSTDWYFEPVNDAPVAFERAFVSGYHWGTLYLPYAVKVPENMTAYYATVGDVNVAGKIISLHNVGEVIPASTPVLLNRSENMNTSYRFEYTIEEVAAVVGNVFEGRIMQSLVECVDGKNYYMLLKAGNGEAFYWVFKEYDAYGNLYQIFTYVKNKDAEYGEQPHNVSGMLLYAQTDESVQPNNVYRMGGNKISVRTLNLNCSFKEIASQLDEIVTEHFA